VRLKTNVRLHGPLADRFGATFQYHVANPAEALWALMKTLPGFRQAFREYDEYFVVVGGEFATDRDLLLLGHGGADIDIMPAIAGAAFGFGVALATALTSSIGATAAGIVGAVTSAIITAAVTTAISYGLSAALSSTPQQNAKGNRSLESYGFSGPVNTSDQGVALPVAYGEVIAGGAVVSLRFISTGSQG
jgi:predicted phage tail protein